MDDLGTALRELARRHDLPVDEAADGPDELWTRGRRRARRVRAVRVAAAVLVLAGVGLGPALLSAPVVVMPAGPAHAPGYPEHLYRPSRWLAGTDDRGALGQLALIASAERGDGIGIVGVSATTGEYRFLDLPGWVRGSQVALAPDGKHVAYWTTGRTTGTPYVDPTLRAAGQHESIAGIAIYDSMDGTVQRTRLSTEHGMSDEPPVWRDSATVYFGDWQLSSGSGATRTQTLSVAVGEPEPVVRPHEEWPVLDGHRNADGTFLFAPGAGRRWVTLRPDPSAGGGSDAPLVREPRPLRLPATLADGVRPTYNYAAHSLDDRVVVQVDSAETALNPLMVGEVAADGTVSHLDVVGPDLQEASVLGWHDGHTLLSYGNGPKGRVLAAVDVDTGRVKPLSRSEAGWGESLVPAVDVLRGDLVPGLKPPDPVDPRWREAGWLLGALAVGGAALWLVRRRRRA